MAKIRSPFNETRYITYGFARGIAVRVEPDEVVEVPNEVLENYESGGWQVVPDVPAKPSAKVAEEK